MDIAKTIKELRNSTGMTRKEFSEHTGIPVRTLEDWEAARRTPPEYIPRLLTYQLRFENLIKSKNGMEKNINIISDLDGTKQKKAGIVMILDLENRFMMNMVNLKDIIFLVPEC